MIKDSVTLKEAVAMTTVISKYILKHSISQKGFNRHPHIVCHTGCLVKC